MFNWKLHDNYRIYTYYGEATNNYAGSTYQKALVCKALEGIVEAAPQMVLQFYIIMRNGLIFNLEGKQNFSPILHVKYLAKN